MAQTVSVIIGAEDRERLTAVIGDRNRPQKHVQRARIVLLSAERLPVLTVAGQVGVSRPAVWRWQQRFAEAGVDGLLRDKTRKPGKAPLSAETVAKVLALPCAEPPGEATHWTGRAVARAVGVSLRAVQRIWQAHRLQPHRIRTFKRSTDPAFAEKVEDIVGLYMDPPAHAVVLSIDEKSQIQALDRTQPGLPLKPGKCGTMTHDYKRNGTTTLFAALNVLDGKIVGRCMSHHRHQDFIKFLNAVERGVPPGKVIHAILDNYATHKHPKVQGWLANHPRWVFHFTPTSASWLNAVEGFFSSLSRRRLERGVFTSVSALQDAITCYIREHNKSPKPFVWTIRLILRMTGNLLSAPEQPKQDSGQVTLAGSHLPAVTTYAELGRDIQTNEPVRLPDLERRRGLYVLGRSGTGKTTLLVSLIEQDIKNGHGVFFLDPHGHGIEEIKTRRNWYGREKGVLFFDPQDERLSFGINLLHCPDISSINERAKTYDRAKGVFDKLWPNMFEDKPWLQKILQSALSVFIENQEYTLADMPLFFRSSGFRDHLVSKVTHNRMVVEFWRDFATKSKRDQEREMEAAQSRAEMVLNLEYVSHIVGQPKTTVNFADIMERRRSVLFKLPLTLSADTQTIIGTISISELLHAVRNRAEVAPDTLNQFCVFVDEIHKFASSRDFAILINEARKFGIATTYAHQERFGQFGDNKEMLGATDAAGTKVFFQTSQKDSVEQAGEFAAKPPVEIRFERDGVIAAKPIAELLRTRHRNQFIRDFTDCYLRPLDDKREDAREDMEQARIMGGELREHSAPPGLKLRLRARRDGRETMAQ